MGCVTNDLSHRSPGRILVVDDDFASRTLLRLLFEDDGYEVAVAENGLQALAAIAARCPDVVVSDVDMPVMDGSALLARLHSEMPRLPVILVSGSPPEEVERLTDAHAFLPKPFDIAALERAVACALEPAAG
jgi:CheY-like chemotaxis protein